MANKFYAVKNGRKNGVFETWNECKAHTQGYKNAVFKSFKTKKEALEFLDENNTKTNAKDSSYHQNEDEIFEETKEDTMIAYIDGSYDDEIKYFSYAGIMFYNGKNEEFSFSSCDESLIDMRNVSGEVKASTYVIQKAKDYNLQKIKIYYDYLGIELWATGKWKANNHLTRAYQDFCKEMSKTIDISFVKVKSHTNVKYNEYVDKLAKKAIEEERAKILK